MNRKPLILAALLLITVPVLVWAGGSHTKAGYNNSRTYLNSDLGHLMPPLLSERTIDLTGVTAAQSLLVFQNSGAQKLLVGEDTGSGVSYTLLDSESGDVDWQHTLLGSPQNPLKYTPGYANDIVLLGGATTTNVRAVRVSTGATLWEDTMVGPSNGRYPLITPGRAIYAGAAGVRSVAPLAGPGGAVLSGGAPSFWQSAVTTAEAPLSYFGETVYVLTNSGNLGALSRSSGNVVWSAGGLLAAHPNIIAQEDYVFVMSDAGNLFGALDSTSGASLWANSEPTGLSETVPLAYAYNQLFTFSPGSGAGPAGVLQPPVSVAAYDPTTGDLLWSASDPAEGADFGLLANNLVWYYNQGMGAIRVRDAFHGNLVAHIARSDVRGLSAAEGQLFVLYDDSVEVLDSAYRIVFAQIADGAGQSTLLTLNNVTGDEINGTAFFKDSSGDPLALSLDGGDVSEVDFVVPPYATVAIQSLGTAVDASVGYAVVDSDGPLSGSSVFRFDPGTGQAFEAGVSSAASTALANTFVVTQVGTEGGVGLNTGVALVNPNGEQNTIHAELLDGTGASSAETDVVLEANAHTAQFVNDVGLFPDLLGTDFVGTVVFSSDLPFVITTIRTENGVQLSSYAAGQ